MSFDYRLALMTGVDIPIPELQVAIHQPTIEEISLIGEQVFFMGAQLLCLNKSMYSQDESLLANTSNFQILMTLMAQPDMADRKQDVLSVLTLLFPTKSIIILPKVINLVEAEQPVISITDDNFENLQKVFNDLFCLEASAQQAFNPGDEKAKEIADKLMKGRARVAAQKSEGQGSGSVFSQYLSIIAIGASLNILDTIKLTMYQMYDLMERYSLYANWDIEIKSRMAGAKGDKPIESWMKNIH